MYMVKAIDFKNIFKNAGPSLADRHDLFACISHFDCEWVTCRGGNRPVNPPSVFSGIPKSYSMLLPVRYSMLLPVILYATSGHGGCLTNCVLYFWPKFRKIQGGRSQKKNCSIYGVSVNYVNSACYLSKVGALLP